MFEEQLLARAPGRNEKQTISIWLLVHFAAACVGVGLLSAIGAQPNNLSCTGAAAASQYYSGCLSWSEVFGVFFVVVMIFCYLWSGENLVFSAARLAQGGASQSKLSVLIILASFLLTVSLCVLSWIFLMKPGDTYQVTPDGRTKPRSDWNIDALEVMLGGLVFAPLFPFAVTLLLVVHASRRPRPSHSEMRLSPMTSTKKYNRSGLAAHSNKMLTLGLFVLALAFLMTMSMGPIWNFTLTYYLTLVSPYSLVFWPVGGALPYCADIDPTVNQTFCVCAAADVNSPIASACWFSFKIYADTLLFYATIAGCLCLGVIARRRGWFRQVLGTRVLPTRLKPFFSGLTLLEFMLMGVTVVLFVFWLLYWVLWYGRFHDLDAAHDCAYDWEGGNNDDSLFPCPADTKGWSHVVIGNLHVLCRASGHMGSLAFALTLLPTGKHSPLLQALGLSWERALHWHKALGYISWLCVCSHFLLWLIKWAHDGTIWKNTFMVDTQAWLWVTPVWNHFENWSVAMMQIAFFGFTAAVGLAFFIRRSHYRLFYISHSFMLVFVALALIHAWSFWYFAVPGLVIWWCDRLWRMVLASTPVSVIRIDFALEGDKLGSELAMVELSAPHLSNNFRAGQYAFLHIPSVSRSEWHPFTFNVWGDSVVFLIKGMNPHGWTQRLKSQIREGGGTVGSSLNIGGDTALSLSSGVLTMGPYGGIPPEMLRADKVLLVAGGIGITPVLATFQACLKSETIRRLHLVWVVREAPLLSLPLIVETLTQRREGVEVSIYLTDPDATEVQAANTIRGRPNLRKIFRQLAENDGRSRESWSFACGPIKLQEEVQGLSEEYRCHCHVETFYF